MSTALDAVWRDLLRCAGDDGPPRAVDLDGLHGSERALATLYRRFLDPYPEGPRTLAHLGQSLDGRIATDSGHSTFVTGAANLTHLHRLRALADAVLVGAGTVASDDPRLTVRRVDGPSPLRVVLDPNRRLTGRYRLFDDDGPETIVLARRDLVTEARMGGAEIVGVAQGCAPSAVLSVLWERGIRRLFVEGGGVTVSAFIRARCLDHLQVCVAPIIIGSGRPAFRFPPIRTMDEAMRLQPTVIPMGSDLLFAFDLARASA